MKKLDKKKIGIISIIFIIIVLLVLVFISLFGTNTSNRLDGVENYKLTNKEIKNAKNIFKDYNADVDIYINNMTIKIFIELEEDEEIKDIKEKCDEALKEINKENLEIYDVEVIVKSKEKDSTEYPIIGHKHNSSESFVW